MTAEFSSLEQVSFSPPTRAPSWPAIALGVMTTLAVLCIWPGMSRLPVGVAGYFLGALAAPVMTVIYRFGRRKAAKSPFFVPNRQVERAVLVLLVIGILAGVANAWFVATELAKQ